MSTKTGEDDGTRLYVVLEALVQTVLSDLTQLICDCVVLPYKFTLGVVMS